jgi:hypothetical protein
MARKAVGQVSLVEALLPAAYGNNQRLARKRGQVTWQPSRRCCSTCAGDRQGVQPAATGVVEGAAATAVIPRVRS